MTRLRKKKERNEKSQPKKLFIHIPIHIYRGSTFVAVNLSDKEVFDSLVAAGLQKPVAKMLSEDSAIGEYEAMTAYFETYSISRYHNMEDLKDLGLVTHEALHCVCALFRFIQLPLTEDSEEAYSYLLGYIMDEYTPYIT